jgi:shikimate kinase
MNKPSQRIVLTGFMGAGKTVVAKSLAARLKCRMIDLDDCIVEREGRVISAIIEDDGEESFRELETRALVDALQDKDAIVIALGGGAWTREQNRKLIAENDGLTVWLNAPFDLCWQRIVSEDNPRPLARDKEDTRRLYDLRRTDYALALLRIEVTPDDSIGDVVEKIIAFGVR